MAAFSVCRLRAGKSSCLGDVSGEGFHWFALS